MSKETEFIQQYVASHKNAFSINDIKEAWEELNEDKEEKKYEGRVFSYREDHMLYFFFFKKSLGYNSFIFDRVCITKNIIEIDEDIEDSFSTKYIDKNYTEITSMSPESLMELLVAKTNEFNAMVEHFTKTNFKSLYELADSNKERKANTSKMVSGKNEIQ